ncbi:MAG TPA: hypothetical protein VEB21_07680 [Terriglobales bacterium]|nr:hypothetical protein [Terriglobales bacterium]
MPEDRSDDATRLPASRAFVIHLLAGVEAGTALPGRVEHVVSGRSARFEDATALIEFFRAILTENSGL